MRDDAITGDAHHAARLRRAAEMQAQWDAEDAVVIDLRDRTEVPA